MWTLESYRITQSVAVWLLVGKFHSLRDLLYAVGENGGALDFRATSPNGQQFKIEFVEEPADPDYVIPTLGEACSHWPQFVGNVRG